MIGAKLQGLGGVKDLAEQFRSAPNGQRDIEDRPRREIRCPVFGKAALKIGLEIACHLPEIARSRVSQKRSEEHTSELQSLMRHSYAVFGLKTNNKLSSTTKHNYTIASIQNV